MQIDRRALIAGAALAGFAATPLAAEQQSPSCPPPNPDWANLNRYAAENAAMRGARVSTVFMGDSITQGWREQRPAFFEGRAGRGISGQTTPQMLLRFQADVVALKPAAVHIMAGTNDLAGNTGPNSAEDYRNNIRAMVTLAKANGIKVILASIPPAAGFAWKPALKPTPLIAELNAWLKSYAEAEGQAFLDYHTALATPEGALRPDLTFDGVHPNHAGYQVMAPLARKALAGQ